MNRDTLRKLIRTIIVGVQAANIAIQLVLAVKVRSVELTIVLLIVLTILLYYPIAAGYEWVFKNPELLEEYGE